MMEILNRRSLIKAIGMVGSISILPKMAFSSAVEHVVQMLNKHPDDKKKKMVFYPNILQVNAGDSVTFESVDKGHNSASIKKMIPDGAEPWKGKINKDTTIKFDVPGFYGYICTPHGTNGMVGLIVVEGEGKLDNLKSAQKIRHRGKSKKEFKEIWEEAESTGLTS